MLFPMLILMLSVVLPNYYFPSKFLSTVTTPSRLSAAAAPIFVRCFALSLWVAPIFHHRCRVNALFACLVRRHLVKPFCVCPRIKMWLRERVTVWVAAGSSRMSARSACRIEVGVFMLPIVSFWVSASCWYRCLNGLCCTAITGRSSEGKVANVGPFVLILVNFALSSVFDCWFFVSLCFCTRVRFHTLRIWLHSVAQFSSQLQLLFNTVIVFLRQLEEHARIFVYSSVLI